MRTTEELLAKMDITKELAIDFFIAFSRFEYALIAASYYRERDNGSLEADWNCFINFLGRQSLADLHPVTNAGQNLIANTPKRLELVDGKPDFEPVVRSGQNDIRFLIESVKRARNNLFHGGKFITAPLPPERNKNVITDALEVLKQLLNLPCLNHVSVEYDN